MTELKKCPCGKTPEELTITEGVSCKYDYVSGLCCNMWDVEFRTQYKEGDELMVLAVKAWNEAPRLESK